MLQMPALPAVQPLHPVIAPHDPLILALMITFVGLFGLAIGGALFYSVVRSQPNCLPELGH